MFERSNICGGTIIMPKNLKGRNITQEKEAYHTIWQDIIPK